MKCKLRSLYLIQTIKTFKTYTDEELYYREMKVYIVVRKRKMLLLREARWKITAIFQGGVSDHRVIMERYKP